MRLASLLLVAAAALAAVVGASPAAAGDANARAAQDELDCTKVIPIVPDQFPAWGESGGWADASQYTTIQLGDIDGDGRAEMIGRTSAGLVTSRFDADTGTWITVDHWAAFSDRFGYADASLYSTLQLADVDGQPGAELVARNIDGIYTYSWDEPSSTWALLKINFGVMDNPGAWANPSGYSTIQLADVDGQPGAELVGRQPGPGGGMQEWKWVGGQWSPLGKEATNSDANGWGVPEHYATLRFANIDGNPGAEMVGRGTEGLETRTWNRATSKWDPLDFSPLTQEWDTPDKYLTIQLGDIDGDGRAELVGRGGAGIESFSWNVDGKQWTRLGGEDLGLTDAAGWQDPALYSTIQLANVTGGRGAELLYRSSSGLNVATFAKATSNWSPLTSAPMSELSDAEGFNLPQSYMTIQAASVVGDNRQEIVARAPEGIETFKATTPAATSFEPTLEPGFPDFTDDQKQRAAYRWVGENAFVEVTTDDVRSEYDDATWKDQWLGAARQLKTMLAAGQTPKDDDGNPLDPTAFKTVATQLELEFGYVDDLNTWSDLTNDLFGKIFVDKIFDVIRVPALMNLPVEGNNSETAMEILSLIAAFVEDIAGLGGEAGELPEVVAGLVETSMDAASAASGEPPSIDSTVAELESELSDEGARAQDANGCVQQAFAQNWGLLKALGEPIATGQLTWDPTDTPAMVAAAQRGYELVLWQTLTPAKPWTAIDDDPISQAVWKCDPITVARPPEDYWLGLNDRYPLFNAFLIGENCETGVPVEALQRVFDRPNPDGTGSLGVPLPEVLCGTNGWRVPRSGIVNQDCPAPWGPGTGPPTASASRSAATAARRQPGVALARIRGLQATVRAQAKNRRARRALIGTLRQAEAFARRARRTRIPSYADMAEATLRVFTRRLDAHAGRGLPRRLARRHAERAFAIRGMLAGLPRGRPPRARIARAPVAVDDSGAGAIRVQCPRGSARRCTGVLRLLRGKRVIARRRFALRPGRARHVTIRLSEPARRMLTTRGRLRVKARATTEHPSGKRSNSARRLVLTG